VTATVAGGGGGWLRVGIAGVADGLSLLSYLGLDDDDTARIAIGLFLAAVGIIAAGSVLYGALKQYLDPLGATIPGSLHRARIGTATLAFLVALAFGVAVVAVALDDDRGPDPPVKTQTA
jgi:Flp pilus assembly pilin Flp